ncbi:MAG: hypothetical protein U0359_21915 [Byssovorax sp.]
MTRAQIHNKFKIFTGSPAADDTLGPLAAEVAAFVREHKVSAKSIGVEYLESSKKLVLSLGYRNDGDYHPVKLTTAKVGNIGELGNADTTRLEEAMAKASAAVTDIICHELYITDEGDLLMVLMSVAG